MKTLFVNEQGDLEFDGLNKLKMIDTLEEVKQRLRLTIQTNMGEWFLNLQFGFPWFDLLSNAEPTEEFRKELVKILDNDPAINEIIEIDIDLNRDEREMEINFVAVANEQRFRERVVI